MLARFSDSPSTDSNVPSAIGASGVLLLLWSTVESLGLILVESPIPFDARYVVGYVTIVPCCIGILYGSRWIRNSTLPVEHHARIAAYCLVGGSGFLVFNVALMAFFPTESVWLVTNWVRWALSMGLVVGLLVGIVHSRSIYNSLEAERQTLRASHLETQRDLVDQLNGLLRHEVLNATQTIVGNASLLMEAEPPIEPDDERLGRIHRQGEELTRVIQEVRSVLDAMQGDKALQPINVSSVLRQEVEKVEDRHPAVDVDDRIPDDVFVRGDALLGRVFGNLLSNAAIHNDSDSLNVHVALETTPEIVVVTIRDDGDGIPERKLESLFDRPYYNDHGLGLYLVRELVRSYGGSIDLVSTGDDGTTFEVTLQRPVEAASERGTKRDVPL